MTHPLIPIDKLLSEAWQASKAHWRSTLKWTLSIALVSGAMSLVQNLLNIFLDNAGVVGGILLFLSVLILIAAVSVLSYGLLHDLVVKELKPAKVPAFWHGFLRIAWAGFLQFLLMAAIIFVGVVVGSGAIWLSRGDHAFVGGIVTFIVMVGILILALWLSVKFSFTGTALLAHDLRAVDAIKASYRLTDGRWWAIFGRSIVLSLVLAGVSIVVGLGTLIVLGIFVAIGALIMHGGDMPSISAIAQMGPSGLWTSTGLFLMAGAIVAGLLVLAIRIPMTIFQLLYGISAHISLFRSLDATKGHASALEEKK